jgi:hypothetical protein
MFRQFVRTDLLILDDWGPDRLTAMQRRHLMEIVEDRYQTASIASFPSRHGTRSSVSPPSRTPSWTASSITPTA